MRVFVRGCAAGAGLLAVHGLAVADCIDDAASFHHVNVSLMRAIAQVESGTQTHVVNVNGDGTTDIGLMQINSSWLPRLAREGITEQSLFDPCTNAYVGAWILSENIRQYGPTWNAVGAYNAVSTDRRLAYAQKVYDTAQSISRSQDASVPILPPSYTPPQTYNPFASLSVSQVRMAPPASPNDRGATRADGLPPAVVSSSSPGRYDFGWTLSGADAAKPVQVFDDGTKVYVQFSDMRHVPAIFADTPRGRAVLRWDAQPPYAVIASLESKLVFRIGTAEATAQRSAINGASGEANLSHPPNPQAHVETTPMPTSAAAPKPAPAPNGPSFNTNALWYLSASHAAEAPPANGLPAAQQPAMAEPARRSTPQAHDDSTDALFYLSK